MADTSMTPEAEAEQSDARDLVWDASAGLADRDRAMLDLHLRQGLEGAELGEAMGVTASNAYVMLNRLKAQVERSLGALLIARLGREDCDDLDGIPFDGTDASRHWSASGWPASRPLRRLLRPPPHDGQSPDLFRPVSRSSPRRSPSRPHGRHPLVAYTDIDRSLVPEASTQPGGRRWRRGES